MVFSSVVHFTPQQTALKMLRTTMDQEKPTETKRNETQKSAQLKMVVNECEQPNERFRGYVMLERFSSLAPYKTIQNYNTKHIQQFDIFNWWSWTRPSQSRTLPCL